MKKTNRKLLMAAPIVALLLAVVWLMARDAPGPEGAPMVDAVAAAEKEVAPDLPAKRSPDLDRRIFRETIEIAREENFAALPIGDIVARIGRTFLGTDYVPHTLDVEGPERLVVNLRGLDCVTFIENTLALARLIRAENYDFEVFKHELADIRYRNGVIEGYASRLHYFSEWIADNEEKGIVRNITRELGGERYTEEIDFMSTHAKAYRQLRIPEYLHAIQRIEERLSSRPWYYIPEERIDEVASGIRDGDIIAATSPIDGLDVAHTGIALWVDGELHLMHAPLVGEAVQISERTLAERVQEIDGQNGIMVARPLPL